MQFTPLAVPDVVLIQPDVLKDDRGYFMECYQKETFASAGIRAEFVQENQSASRQGVLRGLHYQIRQAQGKLLRMAAGRIFDVAVDVRRGSPTFGRWVGAILSAEEKNQLWVPPGFAHGFYVLSEHAELMYKVSDYYAPAWERTLLWDDPALGIEWPLVGGRPPVLSPKDAAGRPLAEAETYN